MIKVNIKKIAKLSGVSTGTVSRVLTGRNDINSITRSKIISIIKETGFVPQVSTSSRNAIALLHYPDVLTRDYPFCNQVTAGMFQASFNMNYDLIIVPIPENIKEFNDNIFLSVLRRGIQGVLIHQPVAEAGLQKIFKGSIIKTVIYQGKSNVEDFSWIDHDNYNIMYKALYTLKDYGYSKIFFAGAEPTFNESTKSRIQAYRDFCRQEKIEQNWIDIKKMNEEQLIQFFIKVLSDHHNFPFGITGCNSDFINPLYSAIQRLELNPPGKIGIIGTDNANYYNYMNPPVSTIVHPYFDMGKKAVELLIGMINGNGPGKIMMESELLLRKSLVPVKS